MPSVYFSLPDILWDQKAMCILSQTERERKTVTLVKQYFARSTSEVCTASLKKILEALCPNNTQNSAGSIDIQHLLAVQTANEVLDAEGDVMANICASKGSPFVCIKGCCGCCHQMVLCSALEAALIVAYLMKHAQKKEAFLQSWPLWQAKAQDISASYMAWGQAFYGQGVDDGSHKREDYSIACPFLDYNGMCTIYTVRPHACRSSVAVDTRCIDGQISNIGGMHNMLFSLYTGHHGARQRLFQALSPPQPETQNLTMPHMVWKILDESIKT